jgi:hypothetical protein
MRGRVILQKIQTFRRNLLFHVHGRFILDMAATGSFRTLLLNLRTYSVTSRRILIVFALRTLHPASYLLSVDSYKMQMLLPNCGFIPLLFWRVCKEKCWRGPFKFSLSVRPSTYNVYSWIYFCRWVCQNLSTYLSFGCTTITGILYGRRIHFCSLLEQQCINVCQGEIAGISLCGKIETFGYTTLLLWLLDFWHSYGKAIFIVLYLNA